MVELRAPTLVEIQAAAQNIQGKAIRTPLVRYAGKTPGIQAEIWLKLENLQPTGSFKVRAASNAIACIGDKAGLATTGVSTASAGNFAQGLAWCCRELGIPCTVVTPDSAPPIKIAAIKAWGATVIQVPYSEWWEIIESHHCPQAPAGSVFIHPGAENAVLAGNATIAAEIAEDLPGVDCIIAPYGSGALVTGIGCGVTALAGGGQLHNCQVLAVEPETAAPFSLSLKAGRAVRFDAWESSFVDGCGGKAVLEEIWQVARQNVSGACAVPLHEVADAVKSLVEGNKVVAEGAGACPVAAALGGRCGPQARKIVCVVSGGGLDSGHLAACLMGKVPRPIGGTGEAEERFLELGLKLPKVPEPKGSYVPCSVVGNLLYTAGHGPVREDGVTYTQGRVGSDMSVEQAVQAARDTGLAVLATLRHELGSLDRVKRVVKTLGMVNVDPAAINQLECVQVVNGFSDLMISVFGIEAGLGPRSAVGVATLPMNTPVEVEAIFELWPTDAE